MVRSIITLFVMLTFSLSTSAMPDDSLKVCEGQQKTTGKGRITVRFVSILEDSRCPIGATCIWAGNAKINVAVTKGKSETKTIELNTTLEPISATVYGYDIKLTELTQNDRRDLKTADQPLIATLSLTKVRQ